MDLLDFEAQGLYFEKLVGLDSKDRIDAKGLLELVIKRKTDEVV